MLLSNYTIWLVIVLKVFDMTFYYIRLCFIKINMTSMCLINISIFYNVIQHQNYFLLGKTFFPAAKQLFDMVFKGRLWLIPKIIFVSSHSFSEQYQLIDRASSRSHDQPTLRSNSLVGDLVIHQGILAVSLALRSSVGKKCKNINDMMAKTS